MIVAHLFTIVVVDPQANDLRHLHELMWPTKAATAAAISVTLKLLPWVIKLLIETAGDRRSHSLKSNHHSQSTHSIEFKYCKAHVKFEVGISLL